jgi:hypothetical protein
MLHFPILNRYRYRETKQYLRNKCLWRAVSRAVSKAHGGDAVLEWSGGEGAS